MKKLLILFLVLVATDFGISPVFAQKKGKPPREVIVIEISVPTFYEVDKREVLINRTSKSKYKYMGGAGKGMAGTVGCPRCSPEEIAKLNAKSAINENEISSYGFTASAWRMGKDKSKMRFDISVGESCQAQKKFMIYRNRQNKIQLNCGVSLVVYYGFETKEAD
ncbi:MAG TPA: hypothetical protein VF721_13985 [Pyrinomonadaceae bacterium]|jgi:hypothetical protein